MVWLFFEFHFRNNGNLKNIKILLAFSRVARFGMTRILLREFCFPYTIYSSETSSSIYWISYLFRVFPRCSCATGETLLRKEKLWERGFYSFPPGTFTQNKLITILSGDLIYFLTYKRTPNLKLTVYWSNTSFGV